MVATYDTTARGAGAARRLVASLAALVTRADREINDFDYSPVSWTHNAFRAFEHVFGRRAGIRREAATSVETINGRKVVTRQFFTWEAAIAPAEGVLRSGWRSLWALRLVRVRVAVPALAPAGFPVPMAGAYRFAIALDATSSGTVASNTTFSVSHTCTGSNRLLATGLTAYANPSGATLTGITYNSAAETSAGGPATPQGNCRCHLYYKVAPDTGANNVTASFSPATDSGMVSVSYTGAAQTGQPDSSASGNGTGATITATTTVVAASCWLVAHMTLMNAGLAASTGATSRGIVTFQGTARCGTFDSNGTVATGSRSMAATGTSDNYGWVIMSIAPAVFNVKPTMFAVL